MSTRATWLASALSLLAASVALGAGGCGKKAEGPPSVILISMDTFRADKIGAFGNKDQLTPNLDAFAAESTIFEHTYSQAVQTAPSHTSMFTSHYPSEETGTDRQPFVPKDMPLLAQLMSLYDYHTGAFVGGADLSAYRGLNAGFDKYESAVDFGSLYHTGPMALAWLESIEDDRPFFLFVHGYDTHSRYLKPPPFGYAHADARAEGPGQDAIRTATERIVDRVMYPDFSALMLSYELFLRPRSPSGIAKTAELAGAALKKKVTIDDDDAALITKVYEGAVSYADTMFGLFIAALQDRGVLDNTWIVVMSDHGEGLGESGIYGHCCEANEEETHVPLMIRAPKGEGGGKRVSGFVELVDVMPTILDIASATPPAAIRGHSLLPAVRGEPFEGRPYSFTEGSEMMRLVTMRGPKGRFSYMGLSATSQYLPDIVEASRLDGPGFKADPDMPTETQEQMRGDMVAWLRRLTPAPVEGQPQKEEMPPALRKVLREHGYWDVQQ